MSRRYFRSFSSPAPYFSPVASAPTYGASRPVRWVSAPTWVASVASAPAYWGSRPVRWVSAPTRVASPAVLSSATVEVLASAVARRLGTPRVAASAAVASAVPYRLASWRASASPRLLASPGHVSFLASMIAARLAGGASPATSPGDTAASGVTSPGLASPALEHLASRLAASIAVRLPGYSGEVPTTDVDTGTALADDDGDLTTS